MSKTAKDLQQQFRQMSAVDILSYTTAHYPGKVTFSSSMGAEDQIITHLISQLKSPPNIFTLDTGRLFYETYDLIEKTSKRYNIPIQVYFPDTSRVEEMVNQKGINLFYYSIENRKMCCGIRKTEPLRRALKGYQIWITGLRREQSPTRQHLEMAEWDDANQIIKVHPLLVWTDQEVWDFIKTHGIPYNPLHDHSFPSIGCQPCTRAVMPGEDIRAGRWWWERPESKECGLHLTD